ncbi:hypothetical protein [Streptomyces sp. NBC_01353]|uniref:hypothetical protein n=1 Tax=Streptomyces sp. NBC_01353 TaxID=2903835 RepID=UPI003DA4CE03
MKPIAAVRFTTPAFAVEAPDVQEDAKVRVICGRVIRTRLIGGEQGKAVGRAFQWKKSTADGPQTAQESENLL